MEQLMADRAVSVDSLGSPQKSGSVDVLSLATAHLSLPSSAAGATGAPPHSPSLATKAGIEITTARSVKTAPEGAATEFHPTERGSGASGAAPAPPSFSDVHRSFASSSGELAPGAAPVRADGRGGAFGFLPKSGGGSIPAPMTSSSSPFVPKHHFSGGPAQYDSYHAGSQDVSVAAAVQEPRTMAPDPLRASPSQTAGRPPVNPARPVGSLLATLSVATSSRAGSGDGECAGGGGGGGSNGIFDYGRPARSRSDDEGGDDAASGAPGSVMDPYAFSHPIAAASPMAATAPAGHSGYSPAVPSPSAALSPSSSRLSLYGMMQQQQGQQPPSPQLRFTHQQQSPHHHPSHLTSALGQGGGNTLRTSSSLGYLAGLGTPDRGPSPSMHQQLGGPGSPQLGSSSSYGASLHTLGSSGILMGPVPGLPASVSPSNHAVNSGPASKTKVCRFYLGRNNNHFGKTCSFVHPCRNLLIEGHCKHGRRCTDDHVCREHLWYGDGHPLSCKLGDSCRNIHIKLDADRLALVGMFRDWMAVKHHEQAAQTALGSSAYATAVVQTEVMAAAHQQGMLSGAPRMRCPFWYEDTLTGCKAGPECIFEHTGSFQLPTRPQPLPAQLRFAEKAWERRFAQEAVGQIGGMAGMSMPSHLSSTASPPLGPSGGPGPSSQPRGMGSRLPSVASALDLAGAAAAAFATGPPLQQGGGMMHPGTPGMGHRIPSSATLVHLPLHQGYASPSHAQPRMTAASQSPAAAAAAAAASLSAYADAGGGGSPLEALSASVAAATASGAALAAAYGRGAGVAAGGSNGAMSRIHSSSSLASMEGMAGWQGGHDASGGGAGATYERSGGTPQLVQQPQLGRFQAAAAASLYGSGAGGAPVSSPYRGSTPLAHTSGLAGTAGRSSMSRVPSFAGGLDSNAAPSHAPARQSVGSAGAGLLEGVGRLFSESGASFSGARTRQRSPHPGTLMQPEYFRVGAQAGAEEAIEGSAAIRGQGGQEQWQAAGWRPASSGNNSPLRTPPALWEEAQQGGALAQLQHQQYARSNAALIGGGGHAAAHAHSDNGLADSAGTRAVDDAAFHPTRQSPHLPMPARMQPHPNDYDYSRLGSMGGIGGPAGGGSAAAEDGRSYFGGSGGPSLQPTLRSSPSSSKLLLLQAQQQLQQQQLFVAQQQQQQALMEQHLVEHQRAVATAAVEAASPPWIPPSTPFADSPAGSS